MLRKHFNVSNEAAAHGFARPGANGKYGGDLCHTFCPVKIVNGAHAGKYGDLVNTVGSGIDGLVRVLIRGSDQKGVVHVACLSYKALEPARTLKDNFQRMKRNLKSTSVSPSIAKKRKRSSTEQWFL